ncbi:hypothetical protein C5748_19750 [Phyllobacterium phragmitis]|uniref:Uncharacterized protein n=1 Tax=Phyllobacterium phragmitis TaxID=2670329 RepID=A0A2S9IME9_9HYPH|nr:hypothetical protein C5748_19750 [Phyllobacterium phragmitis]
MDDVPFHHLELTRSELMGGCPFGRHRYDCPLRAMMAQSNPLPGNTVVWRGLKRLTDIRLGTEIARMLKCG